MRNLNEYPVTYMEIETALIEQADRLDAEGLIGDMRPLLFRTAARMVCNLASIPYIMNPARPAQTKPKRPSKPPPYGAKIDVGS